MNQHQKDILDTIRKNVIISFNRLKDTMIEDKKKISDRPFRIHLKELVETNKVLRIKSRNQHVYYTTKQNYQILLQSAENALKDIPVVEKEILNSKPEFDQLSQIEKYVWIDFYVRRLSEIHLILLEVYEMTNNQIFMDTSKKIEKLRYMILKLSKEI